MSLCLHCQNPPLTSRCLIWYYYYPIAASPTGTIWKNNIKTHIYHIIGVSLSDQNSEVGPPSRQSYLHPQPQKANRERGSYHLVLSTDHYK